MEGGGIEGVVGIVKWAYYNAAAIEGYRLTPVAGAPGFTLRARVILADRYKLAQRPLVFVAPHRHGAWRFPIEDFSLTEDVLTARLGPQE